MLAVLALACFLTLDCDVLLYVLPFDDKAASTSFKEQIVWITGASSGIGAALVMDMVKGGAKVIISARREEQLLAVQKKAAEEYPNSHPVFVMPLDVINASAREEATAKILQTFGHIDVLVLNAGRSQRALATEFELESTRDLFELNFFSYVALTKLVLPSMQARRSGTIVVMSSLAGKMGVTISSSYSASKWALHGYFDALRSEVSRDQITVTLVCPGPVQSEIAQMSMKSAARIVHIENNDKKMATERCTYLVAKAIHHKLDEVWISNQPFLLFTYLSTYAPGIFRQLYKRVVGPGRVKALVGGGDVYDVKSLLGFK